MTKVMGAPRNRTTRLRDFEKYGLLSEVSRNPDTIQANTVIHGDMADIIPRIARRSVDLLILDPPYNLRKTFGESTFDRLSTEEYGETFAEWLELTAPALKPTASAYVCSEWRTSTIIYPLLEKFFHIRNRITWEREKGRAASANWKNTSEDIWFCTVGGSYKFYPDRVRLRRRVIAPYRDEQGRPKDWNEASAHRDTAPSNLWTDITVPFWSMPENTDHPTQKPEKLIAKLVLASSDVGDLVLDPFLGSGTTAVVAKKLDRSWIGIENEEDYCALAQKRVIAAKQGDPIQGYGDGVFWPRNSLNQQLRRQGKPDDHQESLL
jgi:site-specific DNA-methyltransferase (adenine-specific)